MHIIGKTVDGNCIVEVSAYDAVTLKAAAEVLRNIVGIDAAAKSEPVAVTAPTKMHMVGIVADLPKMRTCPECGEHFPATTSKKLCGKEACKKAAQRRFAQAWYAKKKASKSVSHRESSLRAAAKTPPVQHAASAEQTSGNYVGAIQAALARANKKIEDLKG
jgi:hypothetical protein